MVDIAINLEQLSVRESEQIEWKENVADCDSVVKTLTAFANDLANLGGGYVVCGAKETKDEAGFPKLEKTGLTAHRIKEVENTVLTRCRERVSPPIAPIIQELVTDDPTRRLLIFIQPSTGDAHSARVGIDGAKYWVRIGRDTREARDGLLRELLVRKGAKAPWDRRICVNASLDDLDLLALRDALQRMGVFSAEKGVEEYLSADSQLNALVPPLCERESMTGVLRPRNFTMLLFGREPQKFIPGAFNLFSIYSSTDRSEIFSERHEITGTLIEQSRRLNELLSIQSSTTFDKSDPRDPNAVKYPRRALYEAMGNALAHRDYELDDPNRVTVFEDRIEILSPGSLPLGVSADKFRSGQAHPKWRNQALAWFFNRLQIAQAEGQGIPTILRVMKDEGCPPPQFEIESTSVVCVLPAHPRYAMLRELKAVEQDLALGDLDEAQRAVYEILNRDPGNVRGLKLFGEIQASLNDPGPIVRWIEKYNRADYPLPRDVALQFAEAILSGEQTTDDQRILANQLLAQASYGRLEEQELRRITVALIRSRDQKAALRVMENYERDHPEIIHSPSFHQLKGDAFIGLANRCLNAARRSKTPLATRQRSRQEFDRYADQAREHLARALDLQPGPALFDIITRNIEYLDDLQNRGVKRGSRRGGGRPRGS